MLVNRKRPSVDHYPSVSRFDRHSTDALTEGPYKIHDPNAPPTPIVWYTIQSGLAQPLDETTQIHFTEWGLAELINPNRKKKNVMPVHGVLDSQQPFCEGHAGKSISHARAQRVLARISCVLVKIQLCLSVESNATYYSRPSLCDTSEGTIFGW